MKIGVIADDFTGASDIALTLAEGGLRVCQFIGTPDFPAANDLDAGVVALKSRTSPLNEAIEDSLAACDWLLVQGAEQIVFKICSTFDSTADGNIGPVLDALSDRLNADGVIVCPAFPENGRSIYQGHLFVQDKLLNESGMQDHPLTPMRDSDLRRVLAQQTPKQIHHVSALTVMRGATEIRAELPATGYAIVDAIRDVDMIEIGKAAKGTPLLCGGSGIALGLPENFHFTQAKPSWTAVQGSGVVLSGSCSRATRGQVDTYKRTSLHREIRASDAITGAVDTQELADWVIAQETPPLIYSSADPALVRKAQTEFGTDRAATAVEAFFSDLSAQLLGRGVTRFVVAGGETSGAVVKGLSAQVLEVGPRLAAGVPLLRFHGSHPVALALKSGNFGGENFFAEALAKMEKSS
ncbi:3-oxo-tetronate kinase [Ruegeria arenilitoris]|uniref:3-oxo-tetronate kinase n=1 Tax=Ruegeria arenilitoris TaxID=1173585 RepID=UPI00147DDE1B|nr:3-oxo-tetronate kinase [Ruegeria arenilitoris]